MGLPRKIALFGGGSILAVLAVAILATKTNILEKIKQGLANTGTALGQGAGEAGRNFGTGLVGGLTGIGQTKANDNLASFFAGINDLLSGKNPFDNPIVQKAYGEVDPNTQTITPMGAPTLSDNSIITPQNRENYDRRFVFGGISYSTKEAARHARAVAPVVVTTFGGRERTGSLALAERLDKNYQDASSRSHSGAVAKTGGVGAISYAGSLKTAFSQSSSSSRQVATSKHVSTSTATHTSTQRTTAAKKSGGRKR